MKSNFSTKAGSERLCNYRDVVANLADYLPDEQAAFKGTKPYLHLCEAVYAVLTAPADARPMLQQALKHARSVFEAYCSFEIEENTKRLESQRVRQEAVQCKIDEKRKGPSITDLGWGSL